MTIILGGPGAAALAPEDLVAASAEAAAMLRVDGAGALSDGEAARLAREVQAAFALAEQFTGRALIARVFTARLAACGGWQRLGLADVGEISAVTGIPAEGGGFVLPIHAYAIDIAPDGEGWVRVIEPGAAGRIEVTGRAGLGGDWAGLAAPVRQGVVRLAVHRFLDAGASGPVPAAVSALWRPWRRMVLSGPGVPA